MTNNEVFFDEKSGISKEEQQEILTHINGITERNRKSLSRDVSLEKLVITPKKNGAIFPIAVNAAAVVILLTGALLLVSFNGKVDAAVRTGNAVYDLTERALIDEIRKDTADRIAEKEMEIESIAARLGQVDDELLLLYSSNEELNAEQRAAQERLLAMQNAFREELSTLHDERSQILEVSRSREARLRAQLDERAREYAAAQQRSASELDSAMKELERLTSERERLLAMEALITNIRVNSSDDSMDLMAKNVQLQDTVSEMQKTIEALSSGGTGLTRRVGELESTISALQSDSSEKDSKITLLETENSNFVITNTQLRNDNTAKDQRIADLDTQLAAIRQLLMESN